jgi:uncharacterized protein YxjI
VQELRSGISDAEMMAEYRLTPEGLQSLFSKLVKAGLITAEELAHRERPDPNPDSVPTAAPLPRQPTGTERVSDPGRRAPAERGKPFDGRTGPDYLNHDRYLVRRKILKLFGAVFHIFDSSGALAFYSKMKAFKLREDIRLFTDESMTTELLTIKARQIIDFSAAYDVVDTASGLKVGVLKRKGLKSILKDEWIIMDPRDMEIGLIREDSSFLAVMRRFVPFAALMLPQMYHGEAHGESVCFFRQNANPFVTKIEVDFSGDRKGLLDKRLGIAAAVLLCAIEGKQFN